MHDKKTLCEKIRSIYSEIGECGIDVDVAFDEKKNAWIVDLKKGNHHLTTCNLQHTNLRLHYN